MSDSTRSAGPPSASSSASARLVHEVHLQDGHAVDRIGRQQVDADHVALEAPCAHDLAPAARRDAEVDHRLDALQQPEPLVELEQLVGRAAAVPSALARWT